MREWLGSFSSSFVTFIANIRLVVSQGVSGGAQLHWGWVIVIHSPETPPFCASLIAANKSLNSGLSSFTTWNYRSLVLTSFSMNSFQHSHHPSSPTCVHATWHDEGTCGGAIWLVNYWVMIRHAHLEEDGEDSDSLEIIAGEGGVNAAVL